MIHLALLCQVKIS